MDFTLSPEQEALRDSVTRFAARDYGWEQRADILRSGHGSLRHWATFAELGWLGAGLSEEAGGFGGGAVENAVIMEALAPALAVEPLVPHIIAARLLSRSTSALGCEQLAAMVLGERRVVLAHGEGAGPGEPIATTLSDPTGNGIRHLSGRKFVVLGAEGADSLLVSAQASDGELVLCLIDTSAQGAAIQPYRLVDNHRAADVIVDNVEVAPDQILNLPADALDEALDHGTVALCAEAVGVMNAAVWLTRDYLLTRKQFGTTLSAFQALQHKMADMLIETEMARSILFQALASVENDDPDVRRRGVSAAKALVSEAGLAVGAAAIQLHGAIGMTEEYIVGHYYKRLFAIARQLGTGDHHLARYLEATERLLERERDAA
ncbi:MAG: acyl-CoA dehydrogenase family protein [Allosphingosinicella sp.]|uniref:acyl-CoA dehydrogenase family protein n=1 Tax=Allosphingosinicella sp. TaxID=2823234 RepID=UPI0039285853